MPLGGYKGSGLAIMVEILCAVLSGGAMLTQVGGLRVLDRPMRIGQFFLALDVSRFMPLDEFAERMLWLRSTLKASAPAAGYDEVLVAGDPEWREEEHRARHGFDIEPQVWDSLSVTARRSVSSRPQSPVDRIRKCQRKRARSPVSRPASSNSSAS